MRLLRWIGVVVAVVLAALIAFYAYMGGFGRVDVAAAPFEAAEIVYHPHKGPYDTLPEAWSAFKAQWEAAGLESCDALAVYLDPPGTPPQAIRSVLGCRIGTLPANVKARLSAALPVFVLPRSEALRASFPYKNVLSFWLAPMRVYAAMNEQLTKRRVVPPLAIELYGLVEAISRIDFVMPLDKTRAEYQPLFEGFPDE